MKKHINISLTTLAFVGMMVFASQAAIAGSQQDSSIDPGSGTTVDQKSTQPTVENDSIDANSSQSATDDVNDVQDSQEAADAVSTDVDQASEAADVGEDMDTPASSMELNAGDYNVETGDH